MPRKKAEAGFQVSITDAVLALYKEGITSPAAIYSKLMPSYPMLSTATVRNILESRTKTQTKKKSEEKPKEKTEIEKLEDIVYGRCALCGYHITGRRCVFPKSMCWFPEQNEDFKRLYQMRAQHIENELQRRKEEKTKKRKQEQPNTRKTPKTLALNPFDAADGQMVDGLMEMTPSDMTDLGFDDAFAIPAGMPTPEEIQLPNTEEKKERTFESLFNSQEFMDCIKDIDYSDILKTEEKKDGESEKDAEEK